MEDDYSQMKELNKQGKKFGVRTNKTLRRVDPKA